jgi:hypothetical protein
MYVSESAARVARLIRLAHWMQCFGALGLVCNFCSLIGRGAKNLVPQTDGRRLCGFVKNWRGRFWLQFGLDLSYIVGRGSNFAIGFAFGIKLTWRARPVLPVAPFLLSSPSVPVPSACGTSAAFAATSTLASAAPASAFTALFAVATLLAVTWRPILSAAL